MEITCNSFRTTPLQKILQSIFIRIVDAQKPEWLQDVPSGSCRPYAACRVDAVSPLSEGSPYVFVNPATHGPYRRNQPSIYRMLKRLCREAGVREFGFHALRHYFASMLVSTNKVTLCDIQHMLGHQRATTRTPTCTACAPR